MRLDLTDLRVFLQVCEAGSMTAAADRCHLTLAAVSARIRALEEANGIAVLRREARGVAPTAAGEVLAAHARRVLDQLAQLDREMQLARDTHPQAIVLLANSSALTRPLAQAAAEWLAEGTTPSILVRESHSEATVQALRSGTAQLGIVSDAVETRGLVVADLGMDPLVLVAHREHALAARQAVSFREVIGQAWIGWGEQAALAAHLQIRALALGARLEPRAAFPTVASALGLVRAGLGVTVLPLAVVRASPAEGLACVALEDPWANRRLLLCRRDDQALVVARLAGEIVRGCASAS